MGPTQCLIIATAVSAMLACNRPLNPLVQNTSSPELAAGFVTQQPAQARGLLPQVSLRPIISVGDPIPGQESNPDLEQRIWAPIPDGLGAYPSSIGLVLFTSHEIASGGVDGRFRNARVSRLVIEPATLAVQSGAYAVSGKAEGLLFQRLCSASFLSAAEGFGSGWYFTGEEAVTTTSGGMQLAVRADGSETKLLPWLGRFAHENYIAVPGFPGKIVMIGTDDTSPSGFGASLASELYMYVADNAAGVLNGSGKLYVFTSTAAVNSGALKIGNPVLGGFTEVANAASLSPRALQTQVDGLNAFKFLRLEDVDYDRSGKRSETPAIYFVDTGNINGQCAGEPCDLYGSIYRMEFDAADPIHGARLTLLARSRGVDAGDWASPDNIAVGRNSLMLQEDPAYAGFNRAERIWNFKLRRDGGLGDGTAVVELTTEQLTGSACNEPLGTCWESSGIIDASEWLGEGTWLFDVQAHTLPFSYEENGTPVNVSREGGQLLQLRVPGS